MTLFLGRREHTSTPPNMELTTDQDLDTTEFQLSKRMSYIRATCFTDVGEGLLVGAEKI